MDGNILHHAELIETAWKYVYLLLHVGEVQQAIRLLLRVGVDDVRAVLRARLDNVPRPGRRRRLVGTVFLPGG